jgi:hypothetical protein
VRGKTSQHSLLASSSSQCSTNSFNHPSSGASFSHLLGGKFPIQWMRGQVVAVPGSDKTDCRMDWHLMPFGFSVSKLGTQLIWRSATINCRDTFRPGLFSNCRTLFQTLHAVSIKLRETVSKLDKAKNKSDGYTTVVNNLTRTDMPSIIRVSLSLRCIHQTISLVQL